MNVHQILVAMGEPVQMGSTVIHVNVHLAIKAPTVKQVTFSPTQKYSRCYFAIFFFFLVVH